jgi:hypothetical protein
MLLAVGTVVTSWSRYKAALWSGIQSTDYNQANALRVESTRESTVAGQFASADLALFMAWLNAYSTDNKPLEQFYRERFRPEFRQAFDEWLATRPRTNPEAPATPFMVPSYRSERRQHALELENQAQARFQVGYEANHYADSYVLGTVIFSTVLFFCGITQQFREFQVRIALLGIATLLLVLGISKVLVLPRA